MMLLARRTRTPMIDQLINTTTRPLRAAPCLVRCAAVQLWGWVKGIRVDYSSALGAAATHHTLLHSRPRVRPG